MDRPNGLTSIDFRSIPDLESHLGPYHPRPVPPDAFLCGEMPISVILTLFALPTLRGDHFKKN
jgi:hypothetical protein